MGIGEKRIGMNRLVDVLEKLRSVNVAPLEKTGIRVMEQHKAVRTHPRRDFVKECCVLPQRNMFDHIWQNDHVEIALYVDRQNVADEQFGVAEGGQTLAGGLDAPGADVHSDERALATNLRCQQARQCADTASYFKDALAWPQSKSAQPLQDCLMARVDSDSDLPVRILVVEGF